MDQYTSGATRASAPSTPDTPVHDQEDIHTTSPHPPDDTFKSTARDAWDCVKGLWTNPETSQSNALEKLGHHKAMLTGLFIIVSIAILNYVLVRIALPRDFAPLFTFENSIRLLGFYTFPSLSLAIVFFVLYGCKSFKTET